MTKKEQHPRSSLWIAAVIFAAAAITAPAAPAQAPTTKPTCNGTDAFPSPGCSPVYFFQGGTDGGDPVGGVALSASGALYGTTTGGGVNSGTVYEMTPPTVKGALWNYTLLHSFESTDGANPDAPLVIATNGVIYGTTPNGGNGSSCGTVFAMTPPAAPGGSWTFNTIYTFLGGNDGCHPWWAGVVIGKNGVLYGTTSYGGGPGNSGSGYGAVFELTPPVPPGAAWTEAILYSFTGGSDGALPQASLLFTNGLLYGTAYSGGIAACGALSTEGCGVVFELKQHTGGAWVQTVLHTFTGGNDGGLSSAALVIKAGALYGTTSQEDSFYDNNGDCNWGWGCGTVFELAPPTVPGGAWTENVLYHFQPAPNPPGYGYDGSVPVGGVVFGAHGSLYGTTAFGPPFVSGTIF